MVDLALKEMGPTFYEMYFSVGHIVTENRNALIVGTEVTSAGARQQWEAGVNILAQLAGVYGLLVRL